ncbi:MAG: PQQ-binding-like beta-propeller repeat protein [Planctomycetia bacterium]
MNRAQVERSVAAGTMPAVAWAMIACSLLAGGSACGEDWPQFRGPGGRGVGASAVPLEWSDTKNVRWKTPLPGPGSSSPVVWGDDVFVTCYSGYGASGAPGGDPAQLARHLVCVNRADGTIRWQRSIAATMPEDTYEGFLTEHGYASSTPVTDGETVVAFFGKSGVIAFDRDGAEEWRVDVGKESSTRRWGSAASLILVGDTVVVNAAEESQSIRALDLRTGREAWGAEGAALELAYGTPGVVTLADGSEEIVVAMPEEVWGLDPATGKLLWHATHGLTGNVSPSVVVDGDVVYVFGGFRSAGSFAIRAGGKGDVTKSHMVWTSRTSSYVATPLVHEGHLSWIDDRGQAFCASTRDGTQVYRSRVEGMASGGRPVYASPVRAGGRIYVVSRWSGTFVLPAEPRFEILACNRFESDESDFIGTPAIADGCLFLRSGKFLYCVADTAP